MSYQYPFKLIIEASGIVFWQYLFDHTRHGRRNALMQTNVQSFFSILRVMDSDIKQVWIGV